MVYNHFYSGRLAMELDCSTLVGYGSWLLHFTEQLSFKLWPWLGLQVCSHLLHVGSSLRVAAILGQLRQGCARAGRGKRNPERFLKAWAPCSQCKARPVSPRSRGQGLWFLLKGGAAVSLGKGCAHREQGCFGANSKEPWAVLAFLPNAASRGEFPGRVKPTLTWTGWLQGPGFN